MDTAQSLRDTSDALLRDLDVLAALEDEKRSLEPGDPKLVELSERIDKLAHGILGEASRQKSLSKFANDQVAAGAASAPRTSIDHTRRSVAAILGDWREAERRLASAEPDSVDASEARALVDRLRDEYRRASDEGRPG